MNKKNIDWVGKSRELSLEIRDFVDGSWHVPATESYKKYGPRDGDLLYSYHVGGEREADHAVAASRRAFSDGRWARMPVQKRKEILYKLAALIEQHGEEFALRESLDVGKPIRDALEFDVPAAVGCIRFNAESADKCYGKVYAVTSTNLSYDLRKPIGVVAGIIGWNFPLYLAAQKIEIGRAHV